MNPFFFVEYSWISAIRILILGIISGTILYFLIYYFLRIKRIEKILARFLGHATKIGSDPLPKAVAKYAAVFVFLLFLRNSVSEAGYFELEQFLGSVLDYLPHLFLALLITFFGIQMSRTSYTVIYNAVNFENPRTAVILAYVARVIILFFTFTIAINQINTDTLEIIPEYLITSILIGFVAATSLAFGLAFGLGGRAAAQQVIQEYIDKRDKREKNLKNKK